MIKLRTYLVVMLLSVIAINHMQAQTISDRAPWGIEVNGHYLMQWQVIDGDTIPVVVMDEIIIPHVRNRKKYYRKLNKLTRNVVKVYPYAKITGEILRDCERELAKIEDEKDKEEFMDYVEDQLKKEFEGELRNLTISQGRVLIKLIDRETGDTSYELIKKLKGGFSAFIWQGVARLFGSNLKDDFNEKEEDFMIEYIIKKIERGELKVEHRVRKTKIEYPFETS